MTKPDEDLVIPENVSLITLTKFANHCFLFFSFSLLSFSPPNHGIYPSFRPLPFKIVFGSQLV